MESAAHTLLILQNILDTYSHANFWEPPLMKKRCYMFYDYNSGRVDGFPAYVRQGGGFTQ